jgi:HAD superfamily hydrolase (TIGR01509 family)
MRLRAVFFDVGETLADETRLWSQIADAVGVPRFTFFGILGGLAARGEPHSRVYELLGVERPAHSGFRLDDLYPDARPCLAELRAEGYLLGAVGNTGAEVEAVLADLVDVVGSSARWGVEKPTPAFFTRVVSEAGCAPEEIAYVGDRVDNDILPALAAGLVAVHVRRGPWGYLHEAPPGAVRIGSLAELPAALGSLM